MKFNDALSGAALLVLATAVLINAAGFPDIPGQQVGPAVFPGLVAALLGACALLMIVKGLAQSKAHAWVQPGRWLMSPHHRRNFLIIIGCLLFYVQASEALGFLLCSVLILAALFLALSVRRALILPLAVLITLAIHTVFYKGLRVPLPWGVLQSWQW